MKRFAIMALAAIACAAANAQSHPAKAGLEHKVDVVLGDTARSADAYRSFAEVSPEAFNVADAPRFAFVGKDSKFYLGIGGTLKGTISYDFGDPITNPNEFTTSAIDMAPTKGNGGLVQLSAMQSGLYINFVALPDNPNRVGVYIQGNFLGSGYGFQLQYAYAKYRGFTVGYDYSLFTDVAAIPPTIDYEGPNALTGGPNGVIDYRHAFSKVFSAGIGAELPLASYTTSASTATVSQRVPDIPAYIQFNWNNSSWIRFSGILRNIAYRDLVSASNRNAVCWGVKASGSASITPSLTAYYQGVYGRGIGSYIQDLNSLGTDCMPDTQTPGHLKPVEAWGAYAGLQYNFSPKCYCSATYSHVRTYAPQYQGGSTPWDTQYKYAQYAVANIFYNINSIVSVGAEYLYGRRVDMSGISHHDNRIQAMLQVQF